MRDEEFVEDSTVADDEVAALQQRQRRLLRVDDQRRPRPRRRQEVSRAPKVVDVAVARQYGDHQRKRHRATLKKDFFKFLGPDLNNDCLRAKDRENVMGQVVKQPPANPGTNGSNPTDHLFLFDT